MTPLHSPRIPAPSPSAERSEQLARLVYELLDAHTDTIQLINCQSISLHWQGHLRYLRDLQRTGREILARSIDQ